MAFMTKEEYEAYVAEHASNVVSTEDIAHIKTALQPLIGAQFNILSIPKEILLAFEPSQIGTIIGSLAKKVHVGFSCDHHLLFIKPEFDTLYLSRILLKPFCKA